MLAFGTSIVSPLAWADFNHYDEESSYYWHGVHGGPLTVDQRIAGSDVEFAVQPVAHPNVVSASWKVYVKGPPGGLIPVNQLFFEVTDAPMVMIWNVPIPGFPLPLPWFRIGDSELFRFDAAKFNHGETVQIRIEATFKYGTGQPNVFETREYSHEFPFVAHHRMQLLGTQMAGQGNETSMEVAELFRIASEDLRDAATTVFSRYSWGQYNVLAESEASIKSRIPESTLFIGLTHGYRDGINSSISNTSTNEFISFVNEFRHEVDKKPEQGMPPFNIAYLFACDVFGGSAPFPVRGGFNLKPRNAAIIGYGSKLTPLVYTQEQWLMPRGTDGLPLDESTNPPTTLPPMEVRDYFDNLFDKLWNGISPTANNFDNRVGFVVASVNAEWTPAGLNEATGKLDSTPIIGPVGDAYSRLKNVYIQPDEFGSLGLTTAAYGRWWIHLSP